MIRPIKAATLIGLGTLSLLGGCRSWNPADAPAYPILKPAASPTADVSFALIKTGEGALPTPAALIYEGGGVFDSFSIVYSAVLIRHPRGTLLFDTGLGSQINVQFQQSMDGLNQLLLAYHKQSSVREQLTSSAISPQEISIIIPSHLHWDHAGGIEDFPEAEIWIQPQEREYIHKHGAEHPGFIPAQVDSPTIRWKPYTLKAQPYENFERSLDIFGDGSLVLVDMAGHTPGSVGLFIHLSDGNRYFFTGDTTWAQAGFGLPADKFWYFRELVDQNPQQIHQPIMQVHQLMKTYPKLKIVPAHDGRVQAEIGYFPQFVTPLQLYLSSIQINGVSKFCNISG